MMITPPVQLGRKVPVASLLHRKSIKRAHGAKHTDEGRTPLVNCSPGNAQILRQYRDVMEAQYG